MSIAFAEKPIAAMRTQRVPAGEERGTAPATWANIDGEKAGSAPACGTAEDGAEHAANDSPADCRCEPPPPNTLPSTSPSTVPADAAAGGCAGAGAAGFSRRPLSTS